MVATMSKRFDPAEHLTKQGWKGKGTALKTGHLTRPLAVIQKKTLSGVGKDRDEAVPFWDQIFAATAASLSLPSTPLSASPASTPPPSGIPPRLADPRSNKSGSWQTSGSTGSANHQPLGQSGLSVGVRISRDVARRGLYSRFFRGEDVVEPDLEESGARVEIVGGSGPKEGEAGPSRLGSVAPIDVVLADAANASGTAGLREGVKETKEEKAARRAAKAKRREEKAERKGERAKKRGGIREGSGVDGDGGDKVAATGVEDEKERAGARISKKRRPRGEDEGQAGVEAGVAGQVALDVVISEEDAAPLEGKKRKKKRKDATYV